MERKVLLNNLKIIFVLLLLLGANTLLSQGRNKGKKVNKTQQVKDSSTGKKEQKYDYLFKKGIFKKGLFNTIQIKSDLYFEINDSLFQREFLIVNKLSNAPLPVNDAGLNKGMSYENKVITFHKDLVAGKVWVKSSVRKVSSPLEDAITTSVNNNFSESIIEVFDIETKNKDSTSIVIKVNKVFDGK